MTPEFFYLMAASLPVKHGFPSHAQWTAQELMNECEFIPSEFLYALRRGAMATLTDNDNLKATLIQTMALVTWENNNTIQERRCICLRNSWCRSHPFPRACCLVSWILRWIFSWTFLGHAPGEQSRKHTPHTHTHTRQTSRCLSQELRQQNWSAQCLEGPRPPSPKQGRKREKIQNIPPTFVHQKSPSLALTLCVPKPSC